MPEGNKMFVLGAAFMAGLSLMANALHWFISPAAYVASDTRTLLIAAQALAGIAIAAYSYVWSRRSAAATLQTT